MNLISSVLAGTRGVRWLDRSEGWFWSESGINPLPRRISKNCVSGESRQRRGATGKYRPR